MRLLLGLLGLGAGFAAGIVALMFNPLHVAAAMGDGGDRLYWTAIESHGSPLNPAALLGFTSASTELPLVDKRNESANAAVLVLRDAADTPVALATRIRVRNSSANLLRADLGVETHTAIFWPNRGSVILYGYENRWPLLRAQLLQQLGLAELPESYVVAAPRRAGLRVGVLGGSGKHIASSGRYSESISADPEMPGRYRGQMALELQPGN